MLPRQTLMIDADDTLWENNIYFERAIDAFVALVDHPELAPAEVRSAFDRLESNRVKVHGYGAGAFHKSLLAGFEHLTGTACTEAHADRIAGCVAHVHEGELALLEGVPEALPRLAEQHRLILVTKGDPMEQTGKLHRSGIGHHFHHIEVLHEKNSTAYLDLLERYDCDTASTWMIGNSPRSDINPALAAGMHAVYLPHHSTWVLEQEPIQTPGQGQRLLRLGCFGDLLQHFA